MSNLGFFKRIPFLGALAVLMSSMPRSKHDDGKISASVKTGGRSGRIRRMPRSNPLGQTSLYGATAKDASTENGRWVIGKLRRSRGSQAIHQARRAAAQA